MDNAIVRTLFRLTLAAVFLVASAGAQADLQKGENAYKLRNYPVAFKELKPLAENGVTSAQFILGLMYDNGEGVPQDYERAVAWYRLAADHGHIAAQSNLGVMYENGRGVELDYKEAEKWYRKAAEQENAPAQFNLGLLYYVGRGNGEVPKNYKEAASWYLRAAEQGHVPAGIYLGRMYEFGLGVRASLVQAHRWYAQAAKMGNETARQSVKVVEEKMDTDEIDEAKVLENAPAAKAN